MGFGRWIYRFGAKMRNWISGRECEKQLKVDGLGGFMSYLTYVPSTAADDRHIKRMY